MKYDIKQATPDGPYYVKIRKGFRWHTISTHYNYEDSEEFIELHKKTVKHRRADNYFGFTAAKNEF